MTLDIIILIIILLFVIIGIKKGAIKALLSLATTMVSFFVATTLGPIISKGIYNSAIKPRVIEKITGAIQESSATNVSEYVTNVIESFPKFVFNTFKNFGFGETELTNNITQSVENAPEKAVEIIEPAVGSIITALIGIISVIIIFVIVTILFKLLIRLLHNVFKLPGLRQVNKVFGAILGLIQGIVLSLFLVSIIKVSLPMFEKTPEILSEKSVSETYVFKYFYNLKLFDKSSTYKLDV